MKQKTFKNRNKFRNFLLFSFLLLLGGNLQAQPPLKAGFINSFVLPGQKDTINVIKKSELGACTAAGIGVSILSSSAAPGTQSHGTAVLSTDGNKNIIYTPAAGFIGQDSVRYTITCGMNTVAALILINVTNMPEVIKSEACAVTPLPVNWTIIEPKLNTAVTIYNYFPLMVGDIDGDGIVEIVGGLCDPATANTGSYPTSGINICYWDKTTQQIELKRTFNTVIFGTNGAGTMIRYNNQSYIILAAEDLYLYAYDANGNLLWKSDTQYRANGRVGIVNVADFNNDGIPEVYIQNQIHSIIDGHQICSGGATNNYGGINQTTCAADMDGDGNLELVAGTQIYKVNIAAGTMTVIADMQLPASALPAGANPDGNTMVADIDNDGILEVIVKSGRTYVWKPLPGNNSYLMGYYSVGTGAIPMIGNIDHDDYLEIVYISNNPNLMYALKYDPTRPAGDQIYAKWTLSHTDGSGRTSMMLFDFNQDGTAELVYRDEGTLRIIDGSGSSAVVLNSFNNVTSGTLGEYPIIADIDDDGQAEIVVAGNTPGGGRFGYIRVFKTNGAPWAPASKVCNQYTYNACYVKDDLTLYQYPMNPATKFIDKDGNYLQPFNNYMQQATLLNGEGKMLSYGSDLAFDLSVPIVYSNYTGSTVDVTFNIENTGDADFLGNLDVSAYVLQAGSFIKAETRTLVINIPQGASVPISYTITGLPAGIDPANVMQIRINESDNNFLVPECNYAGNFSKALFGAPDYGLCPGNHTLYFYPQNSGYQYVWYDSDPTKTPKPASIEIGDSHDFTKNSTQLVEKLFVEVYDGPSLMATYPVITYLIPDSLTWTGAVNSDWNDYRNWNYPNNPQPAITAYDTVKYQIPAECTNALIPGGLANYPNLSSYSNEIHATPVCDNIYFAFGGEVARTDTLLYNQAFVDLTLNTHQYYMIAPSLKNMYTGDYYITQPNPWLDDRLYEPMFFNVPNPQTLKTAVTTWTGRFNNPDILLNAGQGMAIWYNKSDQGYAYHNPVTTHFPKADTQYRYYSEETQAPTLWGNYMDRTDNHRFIYEPLATTGLVPLSLGNQTVTTGGTPVLIGNPFMAHLNLDPFLTANNTEIYAGYKLASGVASVDGKMNNFVSYQRVGETWFTTDPNLSGAVVNLTSAPTIAPMQSFIVIAKKANPQIKAPVTTMTTTPGNVLRSTAKNEIKVLSIVAQKEDELDKALLIGAGNSVFNAEEDSYKFFPNNNDKALLIYTRSSDGYALDINSFGNYSEVITLGVKTSQAGQITLKFAGMESFANDATLYLNDTKESRTINLSLQEEYTFTKSADEDLFLENRFFLSWVPNAPTDLKNVEQDGIVIQSSGRNIEIISKNGSPLNSIKIDDTQGRSLISKAHYGSSSYHFEAPAAGVYLVKVQSNQGSQVKKVVVR